MSEAPPEWHRLLLEGADRFETGRSEEAIEIFRGLLSREEISATDKCTIGCNIAMVLAKTGRPDEAVTWYDHAATYDPPTSTVFAAEEKAAMLHTHERWHQAMATYDELLAMPDLPEDARRRVENNVGVLRGEA
ncbi:MAG: tetratricopeptide repeat protein [Nocardioides sp.]